MQLMEKKRKPGPGRKKGTTPPRGMIASFRGSPEFQIWFDGLVEHVRKESGWADLKASSIIERSLHCFAREKGYDVDPPKR